MPTGVVVALAAGLAVLLLAVLAGLVLVLRSTTSTVDRLSQRLVALERDAAQLRAVLSAVDDDLGRVADALSTPETPPEAPPETPVEAPHLEHTVTDHTEDAPHG